MRRFLIVLALACPSLLRAADFQPDPRSVQRYGPAYRYPQAGWIVLHIEGEPYQRGVQHGRLMAPEIAAHIRCFAAMQSYKSPSEGWKITRSLANTLFLRRFDREYLEEMKGIADGASAAGAKFDGRAIDLLDIAALNVWPEIDTLDGALDALPTGLEAMRFPKDMPQEKSKPKPMRCSAFAATGPATKDGKIVFGHITMFSLYPGNFYNVWLDIKPAKGHRVLMQSYPGGMQSGMDYYLNDAGLLVSETTIGQTKLDTKGMALASRIRKAIQYADSIDGAVAILNENNNGLYTNEWLMADIKTNEIAMFELGTDKSRLWRSSKKEWFGGTEGFYWGCNNTKDAAVRLETLASFDGRPSATVFHPSDRDKMWLKLYDQHKGKIDAEFGKLAFTTPPLAAYSSLDAKFTTTDMAKQLKTWALYGAPMGRTWQPTAEQRKRYPDIRPLVSNPWAILHAAPPAGPVLADAPKAVDVGVFTSSRKGKDDDDDDDDEATPSTTAAWHGTLFPATDGDIWLATAFANYERIVALENAFLKKADDGELKDADRDQIALELFRYRADYELGARAGGDVALTKIKRDMRRDDWYRIASGKGVLLLHALRGKMGATAFDALMDRFGRENAGKTVTTAAFRSAVEKETDAKMGDLFDAWLNDTGLPNGVKNMSGPFATTTFYNELEQTLIVYGTGDEVATNREAAEALQQAIRAKHANYTVKIKTDRDVTEADLKKNHLLLIGRPDSNRLVERFQRDLPITFGSRSFVVHGDIYAHPGSAVVAAAPSPIDARYSVVVIAGLDAASTLKVAAQVPKTKTAEVVVFPNDKTAKPMLATSLTERAQAK